MTEAARKNGTKGSPEIQEKSFVRKYVWCFLFLCLIAFGAFLVYFESQQQPISATILKVGEVTRRTHRRRHGRSGSYTTYHTTLTVLYDEDGGEKKDDVRFSYRNNWFPPKAGQQIEITTGLLGNKVQYPEDNLEIIGWVIVFFGVLFLGFAIRIAMVSGKENPWLIHPDDTAEGDGAFLLETQEVKRLPRGSYFWTCEVDEEYKATAYRITILVCAGICVFLMAVALIAGRGDTEVMMIMTGCCAFVMLLAFGISRLTVGPNAHYRMAFEMFEHEIRIGSGKESRYVAFRNVKQVETEGNKIRLHTRFGKPEVFIPEADFEVISGYILQRIKEESPDYRS